jgi:hypothetical protein
VLPVATTSGKRFTLLTDIIVVFPFRAVLVRCCYEQCTVNNGFNKVIVLCFFENNYLIILQCRHTNDYNTAQLLIFIMDLFSSKLRKPRMAALVGLLAPLAAESY